MSEHKLSKREVVKGWSKYYTAAEVSSGFERLTAPAFSYGMISILNILYKDHPEEYIKALKRHLMFYNSEATWGSVIFGISCALEEELEASAVMISNLKIGLMGPLAGIGDTINHGMLRPLLLSMFIPIAAAGSWLAGLGPLLIWGIIVPGLAYTLVTKGYVLGRKSVVTILKSGKLNQFINTASVLGLFMMGALSSTYVKLSTQISWSNAVGEVTKLQDFINKIFPNLLPLLVVFGIYFYIKKAGPKYVRILVSILVLSIVLSFFGIV